MSIAQVKLEEIFLHSFLEKVFVVHAVGRLCADKQTPVLDGYDKSSLCWDDELMGLLRFVQSCLSHVLFLHVFGMRACPL